MGVKACFLGSATVLILTPSRQRYQKRALPASLFANSAGGLVPVEDRQTDVEQDDVGFELGSHFYSCRAVMREECRVASMSAES